MMRKNISIEPTTRARRRWPLPVAAALTAVALGIGFSTLTAGASRPEVVTGTASASEDTAALPKAKAAAEGTSPSQVDKTPTSESLASVVVAALPDSGLSALTSNTIGEGPNRSDAAELATADGGRVTVVTAADPGIETALPSKALYRDVAVEGASEAYIRENPDRTKLVVFGANGRLVQITAMSSTRISSEDLVNAAVAVLASEG